MMNLDTEELRRMIIQNRKDEHRELQETLNALTILAKAISDMEGRIKALEQHTQMY